MQGKFFSVEEVNALIPEIEKLFVRISEMGENLKGITMDIKDLFDIWGNDVMNPKNSDHFLYVERMQKRDAIISSIQNEAAQIHAMGAEIKDLKNGLVDFPFDNDGEIIYLCWRYGEKRITYWHSVESGFSGRRRIEELRKFSLNPFSR